MDYWNIYKSGAFRVSVVLILLCNVLITLNFFAFKFHRQFDLVTSTSTSEDEVQSCNIPQLRPVTDEILSLNFEQFQSHLRNKNAGPLQCLRDNLPKFIIDYESNLIRSNPLSHFWSGSKCFYKILEADVIRRKVFVITQEITKIPSNTEHIFIWCTKKGKEGTNGNRSTIYEDYVSQVPVKEDVEEGLKDKPASLNPQNYPSVFILGIDSSSHMNFRRYMPQVHEFLVQEMAALEFHGLNSIGPKTVLNAWPLLFGHHYEDLRAMCATSRGRGQICRKIWPIWKNFQRVGYRTSFSQDDVIGAILPAPSFFHYNLFKITKRLDNLSRRRHGKTEEKRGCYGSTLTFDLLLDNFLKTALTFLRLKKPVWHLSWLSELTHDVNYQSKYGEPRLLRALKQLRANRTLSNSLLFLLSDHGMRFGPMREKTRQGFLEERLPFLYVVLPENFKGRFPNAYSNMKGNSDKLITMFDVHATLAHLPSLTGSGGEGDLILGGTTGKGSGIEEGKAASLFKRISGKRTCDTVGIPPTYCACARKSSISADTPLIQEITGAVVEDINLKLSSHPQCHQLTLSGVTMASRIHYSGNATGFIYEISFLTIPGNASFYASVSQAPTNNSTAQVLNIERISAYGGEVRCISGKELRAFCQCKSTQHNLLAFRN